MGFFFYHLSPSYRSLVIRNLRIAFGEERTSQDIQKLARQTCQRTIANFLGTLKTTLLPTEQVSDHVTIEGLEHLNEALAQGKGAILVLGHMGNWEILNRLHQFLPPDTPAGGIYQPLKNPLVDARLLQRREQDGSRMFNKRGGFHAPASFVKNGGLLIVVADQKVGRAGIAIPFFKRLSSLSPLPALLARKAASPILAAGIETIDPGHWRVVIKPLPARPQTETIIQALEKLIRRSPADYLWLHDRWRLASKRPLSVKGKETKTPPPKTIPVRILVVSHRSSDPHLEERLLEHRRAQDFALSFEFLRIHSHESIGDENSPSHYHAIAPTGAQLVSQISVIDRQAPHPLEILLVDTPTPELRQALSSKSMPAVVLNEKQLPLFDFILSLSINQASEVSAPPATTGTSTSPA